MKTYIALCFAVLSLCIYNAMVVPYIAQRNQYLTALLHCVNGTTFAVFIDGTYYVIQCHSMEIK